jgi:ABC-2 type transport system permease protein
MAQELRLMLAKGRFKAGLRVIWAITAKDIVDAIKNRTTLSTILSILFVMVAYRLLPSFENADTLPRLALYDAGESHLVADLENSFEFDLVLMASQEDMEAYVGDKDIVMLGLVLPADFDQRLVSNEAVELDGYVVHWASAAAAAEVQTFFQEQLAELAGRPVRINTAGQTVYTQKDSRGYALLAAMSVIIAITIVGISLVPHLMIEEKQTKTIDVLLVSPVSVGQVVIGKALTGLFYCLTATAVALIFNMALINQWGLAILAAICGSLFTVALGLLLGSMIEARGQLTLWAWLLLVPLLIPVFLSIMTEILPTGLITALNWIPTVALSKVLRLSFSESAPLAQFGPDLAIVLGWSAPILVAVAWVVRRSDK